jgi:3'-5' exoribonuclease 1
VIGNEIFVVYIQMDNPIYKGRFNHNCSRDFQVSALDFEQKKP